ncbi:hypothetical protein ACLI1A_15835 [Flavobacterium sp. RHBU_3]|uniref:hypothetical protein n=1 Tax=Flavobacterium sp. RHBU_3 TaxID=3391184 RepID=UPI003984F005
MQTTHTTLLLIPGGSELALPQNSGKFRQAVAYALQTETARVIMLADDPLLDDKDLHAMPGYKNVLLIESDAIADEQDAYTEARKLLGSDYLPAIADSGFEFQVVQMERVGVAYEDFEFVDKYLA